MVGCESTPVEGTVHTQGVRTRAPRESWVSFPVDSHPHHPWDESGIRLFGPGRKRIEGGTPRCVRVAGEGRTTDQFARRFSQPRNYGFLFSLFSFRERIVAGVDFAELRRRVSMAQVLELLDMDLPHRRGDQLRGACPIHESAAPRSRSFSVNLRKNAYHCFRCGSAGNQLDLWAAVTRQNLYQAALSLCERLHIEAPWKTNR
jgi:hypothetical protein